MNFRPAILKNREKTLEFTRNKFNKIFIQTSGTYNKHLGHTGTPTNFNNNCIKISGFDVVITENVEFARKVLQLEKLFRSYLGSTSHTFPIKLVTKFSPNRPKFTDKKSQVFYTYFYLRPRNTNTFFRNILEIYIFRKYFEHATRRIIFL